MLLAKRARLPLQWSFPGGSLEPGETAEQAAIREAREEVSVDIEIVAKAGEREVSLRSRRYAISVFAAKLVAGEPLTSPEASEIGWFDLAELASLDTTEGLAEAAAAARRAFLAAKA